MSTKMPGSCSQLVIKFAIVSRISVLILQVFCNYFIVDHNAAAFTSAKHPGQASKLDQLIEVVFGGLTRWDAQYFLHVAEYSYTYENALAFFPLYPITVHLLASLIFYVASAFMNYHSCAILSGVILNFIFFTLSSYFLYKLSTYVLKNQENMLLSAILFSLNPASVFFTAIYSESLFSLLTFSAMYYIEKDYPFRASILIGLSGVTRSNGLILCGYLIYRTLKRISQTVKYRMMDTFPQIVKSCLPELIRLGIQLFLCITPFVMFQVYACMLYCVPYLITLNIPKHVQELAISKNLLMPSENSPPWCYSSIPFPYAYVQSHYWNVGFLRYYELKQVPNFLLAMPLVVLVGWYCKSWCEEIAKPWLSLDRLFHTFEEDGPTPYVLHAIGQTVLCVLCIHVQVTTRLTCASSPIPFWAGASLLAYHWQTYWRKVKREHRAENPSCRHVLSYLLHTLLWGKDNQKVVVAYFTLYIVVGTAMFTNYYPWT